MAAVCGDDAVNGDCANGRSVAQQLSTMPDWLYEEEDNMNSTYKYYAKYDRFDHTYCSRTINESLHTET